MKDNQRLECHYTQCLYNKDLVCTRDRIVIGDKSDCNSKDISTKKVKEKSLRVIGIILLYALIPILALALSAIMRFIDF